jgi:serine-type D-Ala-D-Ala carboxypeptidase (penicillin-binding protein 5/6)
MKAVALVAGGVLLALAGCSSAPKPRIGMARPVPQPHIAAPPPGNPGLWPAGAPSIYARSAILIDARTGRTLYQKNADATGPVASTQKLLTALLVVEDGSLDQMVRIAREDTLVKPTKLGFKAGETYSRRTLLSAMMVKSQNDAAAALARAVSGSEPAFVAAMNGRAWELGARASRFANAHGLPANQYSTVRDIARIAWKAYREPVLRRLMATRLYTFVYNSGRTKSLENTNKLLGKFAPVNGMKTGYTIASGRCLVASASSGGREIILVQIGSRTKHIFSDAERMLTWGLGRSMF